jgi:hypothetical protein
MRNICTTKSNKKLNNNLGYYNSEHIRFFEFDTKQSIYKMYYASNKSIDTFIINSSQINPEIIDFITQLGDSLKIIIYHDDASEINISNKVHHIVDHRINIDGKKIPQFIINDKIYDKIPSAFNKTYDMIYFLDQDTAIRPGLSQLLYPNGKSQIRLFNGEKIQHYQNIGYINEQERKNILLESKTLLFSNEDYVCEAAMCGCGVADVSSDNPDIIFNNVNDPIVPENIQFTTYAKIIEEFIL